MSPGAERPAHEPGRVADRIPFVERRHPLVHPHEALPSPAARRGRSRSSTGASLSMSSARSPCGAAPRPLAPRSPARLGAVPRRPARGDQLRHHLRPLLLQQDAAAPEVSATAPAS
jgi:hypothetical protein